MFRAFVNKRFILCHTMFRLGVGWQDNPARLSPAGSITAAKVPSKKEICKGGGFFCTHMNFAQTSIDMASLYYPISILLVSY